MSNQEHYFENLLFSYKRGGSEQFESCKQNDSNIKYLSTDVKRAIEICASYVIDCCGWEQDTLGDFLAGDFRTGCGCACGCV